MIRGTHTTVNHGIPKLPETSELYRMIYILPNAVPPGSVGPTKVSLNISAFLETHGALFHSQGMEQFRIKRKQFDFT